MASVLLLVSIGPVQDFIATARQCQDLWYGSHLLSELSRAAAKAMNTLECSTLIFPANLDAEAESEGPSHLRGVANKILAQLTYDELSHEDPHLSAQLEARVAQVAQQARDAVKRALNREVDRAFGKVSNQPLFHEDVARTQVSFEELIEWAWATSQVSSELPPDEAYACARTEVEATLSAVKASKLWSQPSWERASGVPKSSLDGVRESVIDERAYGELSQRSLRRRFQVKKSERLCGVGLLKRLGVDLEPEPGEASRPTFHSTSHIAAAPHLCAIAQCQPHDELQQLAHTLKGLQGAFSVKTANTPHISLSPPPWLNAPLTPIITPRALSLHPDDPTPTVGLDGYLLYPNRAHDILERLEAEGQGGQEGQGDDGDDHDRLNELKRAQGSLLKALGVSEPHAYYALLLADGDRMGAAIDALKSLKNQQALGRHLNAFAEACRALVEEHAGSLIYSGGDDVLALVPLHTALACANALRCLFTEKMMACERDVSPKGMSIEGYLRPTLSVGLAVMHHLEPMGEALSVARDAERHAKLAGRNALAIKAVPRGGAPYEASAQWPSEAQPEGLVERLHAWMGWLESGALPRGVSHDLMTAADLFDERQGPQSATLDLDGPFKAYVTQVIQQKRSRGGQDTAGEAPIEAIYAYFEGCQGAEDRHQRVLQLAHELEIARFFKRAYEAAWPQTGARAL